MSSNNGHRPELKETPDGVFYGKQILGEESAEAMRVAAGMPNRLSEEKIALRDYLITLPPKDRVLAVRKMRKEKDTHPLSSRVASPSL